jgi:hypothetical protein
VAERKIEWKEENKKRVVCRSFVLRLPHGLISVDECEDGQIWNYISMSAGVHTTETIEEARAKCAALMLEKLEATVEALRQAVKDGL